MKMLSVVLIALLLQEPATTLTLTAPKDSKPADVEKAAKAMEKRCAEYGYKGVKAKAADGGVEFSCETGITPAMTTKIADLASRPCSRLEFLLLYPMSSREAEQYQVGKTAPKGAGWVKLDDGETVLALDGTRANVSGRVSWKRPTEKDLLSPDALTREPHFEFSEETTKVMWAQVEAKKPLWIVLLIDGRQAKAKGTMRWRDGSKKGSIVGMWKCEEAQDETVGICLNNPLPFALEPKK